MKLIREFSARMGLALLLVGLGPLQAFATVDGLWVWQPSPNGPRYLLPKVEGMDPSRFAELYQKTVRTSPVYNHMDTASSLNMSTDPSTFSSLPASSPEHPNVAVLVNRFNQISSDNAYLLKVIEPFERDGPNLFAIPIGLGLDGVLSPAEMKQFQALINHMDGMLGLGGDDAHPLTYDPEATGRGRSEGEISLERDQEIMSYMTEYLRNGKGKVFFVCASMQRAGIADGRGFRDDVTHLVQTTHRGNGGYVMIEVTAEPDSELALAAGSTRFMASHNHHQGVDPDVVQDPDRPPTTRITAHNINPDGTRGAIVETLEFQGNAGFATQFHFERGNSSEEVRIIKYAVASWKMRGRFPAQEVYDCLMHGILPGTSLPH